MIVGYDLLVLNIFMYNMEIALGYDPPCSLYLDVKIQMNVVCYTLVLTIYMQKLQMTLGEDILNHTI
jgi:hypothetical protein